MAIDYWGEMPESTGDYEQKGVVTLIPEGTRVLATIEEIKTQTFDGSTHESLNLKWRVEEPEEYNNRVFYQTIRINGSDPFGQYYDESKQEKQIKDAFAMLSAIDKNSGGNIMKLMRKPTDSELSQFMVAAKMWVLLGVYNNKQLVRGVSAFRSIDDPSKQAANAAQNATTAKDSVSFDENDDIPFN